MQFRTTISWKNILFITSLELKSQTYLHDIKFTAQSRLCRTETISCCVSKQICYFKSCVPFSNHYSKSRRLELQKKCIKLFSELYVVDASNTLDKWLMEYIITCVLQRIMAHFLSKTHWNPMQSWHQKATFWVNR